MVKTLARRLRVVAPTYEMGASGYYRIELPLIMLRSQKRTDTVWRNLLQVTDEMIENDPATQKRLANVMGWSDIIFLEREARADLIHVIEKAKSMGKKVAMDIDDHVIRFVDIPAENVAMYWEEHAEGFLEVLGTVDTLITTTPRMAAFYQPYMNSGGKAVCIPNFIDSHTPRWQAAMEKRLSIPGSEYVIVGWMGGHTHLHDLEIVKEAILRAVNDLPIIIKFVGLIPEWTKEIPDGRFIADGGYTILDEYPLRYCNFDIGLIPLERNEFNDIGKSDLKFLEYGILGIPSIVSRSPAYNCVANNRTGIVVGNNTDEWYNAIKKLVDNKFLREKIGIDAMQYVHRNRSIEKNAYRWSDVFKEMVLRS